MKMVISQIIITIIGIALLGLVLIIEIDGVLGFLLATLGVFLIIIGLTFKGLVRILADFL